ncbi:dephospho-CoA kinase [Boudabousia marimammalium]|uniref:Dephospho-CoA kinase n=1 Tax=Boudabousia marimammalium TaxID=156892 RepID=A0A1Q5PRD0_9ACTO|nr:dephospho-CoA kinase [Boudabousia marimammalium]
MVLGLTGGIGAGKSTVSATLAACGAYIVDADLISRELVEPGSPTLTEIVAAFPGEELLLADGSLDRSALAGLVFNNLSNRAVLDSIMLPQIISLLLQRAKQSSRPVVILDVALLIETGIHEKVDAVCVLTADKQLRLDRLEGRGLSRTDAQSRMEAQLSDEERLRYAHWNLLNNGSAADTKACAQELYRQLNGMLSGH